MLPKTQNFNGGVVRIYSVSNVAQAGDMPVDKITLKQTIRYHERTVGLTRYYTAQQANVEIKYLLRCPRLRGISTNDVAIPNDGKQYRISFIQYPEDIEPPVMDLTLVALAQVYDIYRPDPEEPIEEPPDGGDTIEP